MVTINLEKTTYVFNPSIFNNENIKDKNYGGLIVFLLIQLKTNGKSNKYSCNNTDLKNNFYFNLEYDSINLKVPFKAMLFIENASKLTKIASFSMSTSTHCNGLKYKTCKAYDVENDINYCYGCTFENCRTNKKNINSIESNFISSYIFRHYSQEVSQYINFKGFKYIRYSNHGSFIDIISVMDLYLLSCACASSTFYGYIEYFNYGYRLQTMKTAGYGLKYQNNLINNGSNFMLDNAFNITSSLPEYYHAKNRCLDDCISCQNCLKVNNQTNTNLLHGLLNKIDNAFNTEENTIFIESFFDFKYKINDFKGKLFLTRIKKMFEFINNDLNLIVEPVENIKNYKDLIFYIESNYL